MPGPGSGLPGPAMGGPHRLVAPLAPLLFPALPPSVAVRHTPGPGGSIWLPGRLWEGGEGRLLWRGQGIPTAAMWDHLDRTNGRCPALAQPQVCGHSQAGCNGGPGQGQDGRALRQETYIPRRSGPPLGTLPARRAVCGQCHLPWGPGRRCPCLAPLGTAGERRVGGSLQIAPSTASRHSLPPANGCLGGAACGTPHRPQPQPQSHLAVTVVTTQWDGTSVGVAPWLCRPPTHPAHPACWGGSYFEARAV